MKWLVVMGIELAVLGSIVIFAPSTHPALYFIIGFAFSLIGFGWNNLNKK